MDCAECDLILFVRACRLPCEVAVKFVGTLESNARQLCQFIRIVADDTSSGGTPFANGPVEGLLWKPATDEERY